MANQPKSYFLIGIAQEEIRCTRRAPTLRQMLQNFVFYHLEKRKDKKSAASIVMANAMISWNELGMETRRVDKCEAKMIREFDEWMYLSKYHEIHSVQSNEMKNRIVRFTNQLDQEFDVKSIEVMPQEQQSASEKINISEADVEMEEGMAFDIDVQGAEVEPCTSGVGGSRGTKRSATQADLNVKDLSEKSTIIDEDGEKIIFLSDFFVSIDECIAIRKKFRIITFV